MSQIELDKTKKCPKCGKPWSGVQKSIRPENYGQKYLLCPDLHEYKVAEVIREERSGLRAVGLDPSSFRQASP